MSPALALRTNLVAVDIGLISDLLCYSLQSAISTTTFYTNLIKAPYNLIKVPLSHPGSTQPSRFHSAIKVPYNLIKVPYQPSRFHTNHQGYIQPSKLHSTIKVTFNHQGYIQPSRLHA